MWTYCKCCRASIRASRWHQLCPCPLAPGIIRPPCCPWELPPHQLLSQQHPQQQLLQLPAIVEATAIQLLFAVCSLQWQLQSPRRILPVLLQPTAAAAASLAESQAQLVVVLNPPKLVCKANNILSNPLVLQLREAALQSRKPQIRKARTQQTAIQMH